VGILGGSFNPPHIGHLVCAQEAHAQLGLDIVVLMPVGSAPHKQRDGDPGAELRHELCQLAVAGDERLAVSRLELDRAGPSFTVDTLRQMHEDRPDDELTFIAGADMARSLASWRDPRGLLQLARFAVAERSGVSGPQISGYLEDVGPAERFAFFDMPRIDISSSVVRRRAAQGESIRYLVPDEVRVAVQRHGLYREAAA